MNDFLRNPPFSIKWIPITICGLIAISPELDFEIFFAQYTANY